jgi:hypothetical protein
MVTIREGGIERRVMAAWAFLLKLTRSGLEAALSRLASRPLFCPFLPGSYRPRPQTVAVSGLMRLRQIVSLFDHLIGE